MLSCKHTRHKESDTRSGAPSPSPALAVLLFHVRLSSQRAVNSARISTQSCTIHRTRGIAGDCSLCSTDSKRFRIRRGGQEGESEERRGWRGRRGWQGRGRWEGAWRWLVYAMRISRDGGAKQGRGLNIDMYLGSTMMQPKTALVPDIKP